jgi:hypothetical protein
MFVVGVDVSSHAIDIVGLPLDGEYPVKVQHIPLPGLARAVERAQLAPDLIPRGGAWDEVVRVAVERPYGPGGDTLFALHLVVGAVIGALPERLRPVLLLNPSSWRARAGLSGRASKADVKRFVRAMHAPAGFWKQDTCDAFCIARAARIIERGEQQ